MHSAVSDLHVANIAEQMDLIPNLRFGEFLKVLSVAAVSMRVNRDQDLPNEFIVSWHRWGTSVSR